ncbi:MAG: flagellar hook-basal body protein [Fuerstiella sp.]|nr:flagellar hook-basal body protein [Fuerstiella sp.]MCP4859318.1 flagellar hook-basal body protein [Fuerstiella sp.]
MISGLYSAATAMDAAATRHEASAANLANAHMPGFRRRVVAQSSFENPVANGQNTSLMAQPLGTEGEIKLDFTEGVSKQTGRNLDFALRGDGFFAVEGPAGPLYTRNGAFQVNEDGDLTTVDGLLVRGVNGTITLPPTTSQEAVMVDNQGRFTANGLEFGQLETVQFADNSFLNPVGASLFQAPNNITPEDSEVVVEQGAVEQGNVSYMDELVNIMVASRQYEAAQRVLRAIDEAIEKHINN